MMMRILAAACLVAVALSLPERNLSDAEYEGMWQGYVADFKKVYHPAEVMTRFEIFKVPHPHPSCPVSSISARECAEKVTSILPYVTG